MKGRTAMKPHESELFAYELVHRKGGWHYTRPGHAPLSGLCPSPKVARKAALRGLEWMLPQ